MIFLAISDLFGRVCHPLTSASLFSICDSEEHHKGKSAIPETTGTSEGSAGRNIQRKNNHDHSTKEKKQGGGGGGKGKWNELDDGSMPEGTL